LSVDPDLLRQPDRRPELYPRGLFFGETLGQLGIFLVFILVLLVRPTGLFGARA
jgi:branched-subunit amino acid ABC-type transport system permease component